MKLTKLLEKLEYSVIAGSDDISIKNLYSDSRKVGPGDVFVCIEGAASDGHRFIADVARAGAAAIVVKKGREDEALSAVSDVSANASNVSEDISKVSEAPKPGTTIVSTENTRLALACMSAAFFGYPAESLVTIGITGTKGKTTTTYMIKSVLESIGIKTGLIGTIETIIGDKHIPANNTTPESYVIQESFAEMVDAGIRAVVLEVSSQGLMLDRVSGFTFDYGIFTNLGKDHIGPNEHKSFEEYLHWKSSLFKKCRHGIINADDEHADAILEGHTCTVETYGMGEGCDFRASDIELFRKPSVLGIKYHLSGKLTADMELDIPGTFNVYNSLSAIALCSHFTKDTALMHKALEQILVKGRTEIVRVKDEYTLMIDYAHNAMALESLITTLKEYKHSRIIVLFGCGGDRSRDRRFEMGEVASRMADLSIVTSDNPRTEDPEAIIDDIMVGIGRADGAYVRITDRKEAIRYAITHGGQGDIIVLAGKGHETYQEINHVKYDMDERVLIAEVMQEEGIPSPVA